MFAENVYLARRIGGEPAQVVGGGPIAGLVDDILARPTVFAISSIGYAGLRTDWFVLGIQNLTRDKIKAHDTDVFAAFAKRVVLVGHELVLTERQGENLFIWDMWEGGQQTKSKSTDAYLCDVFENLLEDK